MVENPRFTTVEVCAGGVLLEFESGIDGQRQPSWAGAVWRSLGAVGRQALLLMRVQCWTSSFRWSASRATVDMCRVTGRF